MPFIQAAPVLATIGDPGANSGRAGPKAEAGLFPRWRNVALANAGAALKSAELAVSGVRLLGAVAFAFASTATDEVFAHLRSRLSCRDSRALLDLERDFVLRTTATTAWRAGVATEMLVDVGIDAAYPIGHRLGSPLAPAAERPDD